MSIFISAKRMFALATVLAIPAAPAAVEGQIGIGVGIGIGTPVVPYGYGYDPYCFQPEYTPYGQYIGTFNECARSYGFVGAYPYLYGRGYGYVHDRGRDYGHWNEGGHRLEPGRGGEGSHPIPRPPGEQHVAPGAGYHGGAPANNNGFHGNAGGGGFHGGGGGGFHPGGGHR